MSELGDELHRFAEQGAEQARPLPATRSAVSTPVPAPSATSPLAVPSPTRSGLQPVPTKSS